MKAVIDAASNFRELARQVKPASPFRSVGAEKRPAGAEALKRSARDFEALFVRQLLTEMRRSIPKGDPDLKAPGEDIYQGMLDSEFAKHIAGSGRGLGLADMLTRQFEKAEGAKGDRFEAD